jgi:hypothetical protein
MIKGDVRIVEVEVGVEEEAEVTLGVGAAVGLGNLLWF